MIKRKHLCLKKSSAEFVLHIELGNDAMQTPQDVALALEQVAQRLRKQGDTQGRIHDTNGNVIGTFSLDVR